MIHMKTKPVRIAAWLLALCLSAGLAGPALAAGAGFKDVKDSDWFYADVMSCAGQGIVSGFEDGSFRPDDNVSVIQFLVMLTRTFYPDELAAVSVPQGQKWYYSYLETAKNVGMTENLSPINDYGINRSRMALVLNNVLKNKGITVSQETKDDAASKISDYQTYVVKDKYADDILTCYALGIITGVSDGTFSGDQYMTRAQACTVMTRMIRTLNGESNPVVNNTEPNHNYGRYDKPTDATKPATTPAPSATPAPNPGNDQTERSNKLANGKDITIENVNEILAEIKQEYPDETIWGVEGTPNNHYYAEGCELGSDIRNAKNFMGLANVSMNYACGGWAAMVSDRIFGTTGAPIHEVTDPLDIRPGDIRVSYDGNGNPRHVGIMLSISETKYDWNGNPYWNYTTCDGNYGAPHGAIGTVGWGSTGTISLGLGEENWYELYDQYHRVFTRYPD